jgi:hypothetical protein
VLWLTILVALLLAALAIVYVAWPLLRPTSQVALGDDSPLAELIHRKDTLLLSIKDLEFDRETGKLTPADFMRLDQRLRQQAIALLRQIEQTMPNMTGLEAELEAAIQRQRRVADSVSHNGTRHEASTCPHCRAVVGSSDKFCPQCGTALVKVAT